MALLIALALVAASFIAAFMLRTRTKLHSFTVWFLGALVLPVALSISELFFPTGWLGVALFFGGLLGATSAALGLLVGWLVIRKRPSDAAS